MVNAVICYPLKEHKCVPENNTRESEKMYLKSGFDPEVSACIAAAELAAGEMYLLNDSLCGEMCNFAIPSACEQTHDHYFCIPAVSIDLGRFVSVHIPSPVLAYSINNAFPSVMELFVTVTSPILKTLSRVVSSVRKFVGVSRRSKKRTFSACRPCVLRL